MIRPSIKYDQSSYIKKIQFEVEQTEPVKKNLKHRFDLINTLKFFITQETQKRTHKNTPV